MSRPTVRPVKPQSKMLKGSNQLRIIGGAWRGRKLGFPDVEGLRPTGDRIRETLFNWLAPHIQGSRCLDLFAGSGALGLEALSRGANISVLIEKDPRASQSIGANLALLNAEGGQAINMDAFTYLKTATPTVPFDIVFIDPPFQLDLWQQAITLLEASGLLANGCAIYVESGIMNQYQVPLSWIPHRDKTAGNLRYRLFYRNGETSC